MHKEDVALPIQGLYTLLDRVLSPDDRKIVQYSLRIITEEQMEAKHWLMHTRQYFGVVNTNCGTLSAVEIIKKSVS